MKPFRVAQDAPTWRHVAATLAQTVVFWSVFLLALPELVVSAERSAGLPPLDLPLPHWIAPSLFALASVGGLSCGLYMAVHGRGTPLPLATARELVRTGPYRWYRNPMATCGIGQGLAVGLWRDSGAVVLYALAGAVLWHTIVRPVEERDLQARFGSAFAEYRRTTPLWMPRFGGRRFELVDGTLLLLLGTGAMVHAVLTSWLQVWRLLPFVLLLGCLGAHLVSRSRQNDTSSGQNTTKSSANPP